MDVPGEHLYWRWHSLSTTRRSQKIWQYWQNVQKGKASHNITRFVENIKRYCDVYIDSGMLQIMTDTVKDPCIKRCCLVPNRLTDLQNLSDGLERCQKSLNDYLDSKRNAFPRFFFISDDELLSILGSSEATCVQEHMIKVILPCLHCCYCISYSRWLLLSISSFKRLWKCNSQCAYIPYHAPCLSLSKIISCRTTVKP